MLLLEENSLPLCYKVAALGVTNSIGLGTKIRLPQKQWCFLAQRAVSALLPIEELWPSMAKTLHHQETVA